MRNRSWTPAMTPFLICIVMASAAFLFAEGQTVLRDFMGSERGLLARDRVPPHGLEDERRSGFSKDHPRRKGSYDPGVLPGCRRKHERPLADDRSGLPQRRYM